MLAEKQLSDDALNDVNGGVNIRLRSKAAGKKSTKYMNIACGRCGNILRVDINNATSAKCKCGFDNKLAG